MELFKDFANPDKANQELTNNEKLAIQGLSMMVEVLLMKFEKVKTYGDLNKLTQFIDDKFDETEDITLTEENMEEHYNTFNVIASEITKI